MTGMCFSGLLLISPLAWTQQSAEPDAAGTPVTTTVTINEYIVRGNTVLQARDIERAVPPARSMSSVRFVPLVLHRQTTGHTTR